MGSRRGAAAYAAQSPITFGARSIDTPTLIMGDVGDASVPIINSYEMYHALKDRGVKVQFMAYPVDTHITRATRCGRRTSTAVGSPGWRSTRARGMRVRRETKAASMAEVAELADARDSKSREVTPHVGSIPTFGSATISAGPPAHSPRMSSAQKCNFGESNAFAESTKALSQDHDEYRLDAGFWRAVIVMGVISALGMWGVVVFPIDKFLREGRTRRATSIGSSSSCRSSACRSSSTSTAS